MAVDQFIDDLEQFGTGQSKWVHPDYPGMLIREVEARLDVASEVASDTMTNLVQELPMFGIQAVGVHPVLEGSSGHLTYLVAVDFVDGVSFERDKIPVLSEEMKALANKHFAGIYDYLSYKFTHDEPFLVDIEGLDQCMYVPGTDSLLLVDIGMGYNDLPNPSFNRFDWQIMIVRNLFQGILELNVGDNDSLIKWRQKAANIVELVVSKNEISIDEDLQRLVDAVLDPSEEADDEISEILREIYFLSQKLQATSHGS